MTESAQEPSVLEFTKDFPEPSAEGWKALVEKNTEGKTFRQGVTVPDI